MKLELYCYCMDLNMDYKNYFTAAITVALYFHQSSTHPSATPHEKSPSILRSVNPLSDLRRYRNQYFIDPRAIIENRLTHP